PPRSSHRARARGWNMASRAGGGRGVAGGRGAWVAAGPGRVMAAGRPHGGGTEPEGSTTALPAAGAGTPPALPGLRAGGNPSLSAFAPGIVKASREVSPMFPVRIRAGAQAILDANANPGLDQIHFNIPGAGPHTILVSSDLPGVTSPVLIDGYTQPGSAVNTNAIATNAQLKIELRPDPATPSARGLTFLVGSEGSTVRGLVINRFPSAQISVTRGSPGCVITGNFIGTDPTGTVAYPSQPGTRTGISVSGERCRIGGPARADRNLVSGLSGT